MPNQENNNFVYDELKESIKTTMGLLQTLMEDNKDTLVDVATLEAKLADFEKDINELLKIIRDGNGTKPLMTRCAIVEENIKTIIERDAEFRKFVYAKVRELDAITNKNKLYITNKKERATNREKTIGIIIQIAQVAPGIIALIMSLLQMFK